MAVHLVFSLLDRSPTLTRGGVRRVVATLLSACEGKPLLAFHVSDSHVHLLVALDRDAAGGLSRAVLLALRAGGVEAGPASYTMARDAAHLASTFEYVLRNDEKHGVVPDPWRENGALPDLLGLRALPSTLLVEVRRHLPRINGAMLRAMAGWPELTAATDAPSLEAAVTAATAALALAELTGRSAAVVDARRAVAQLVPGVPRREVAAALGCSSETVRRMGGEPARPALLRAVKLHLSLQAVVPLPPPTPFPLEGRPTPWAALPRFGRGGR